MTLLNIFNSYYSLFWENSSLFLKIVGVILILIILIIVLRLLIAIDTFGSEVKVVEIKLVNKQEESTKNVSESTEEKIREMFSGKWYYSFQIEGREYLIPVSKEKYILIPFMKNIEFQYVKGRFSSKVYLKAS